MNIKEAEELLSEIGFNDLFEKEWEEKTGTETPKYRILIFGSTIEKNRDPIDLDIICEYTGKSIEPSEELAIEKSLHRKIDLRNYNFKYIDPIVCHFHESYIIIENSSVGKAYDVSEKAFYNP